MEDGFRTRKKTYKKSVNLCYNPCSCGRWSQRLIVLCLLLLQLSSLNPCSCGGWFQRWSVILASARGRSGVLILVLVEDGLRALTMAIQSSQKRTRLNPCSCGRWSQRVKEMSQEIGSELS